jgi:hypothetical protein
MSEPVFLVSSGRKASKLVDLSTSNYGYDGKRFHGAFTGGFNAGFYNTVGSVEGEIPVREKKSSSLSSSKDGDRLNSNLHEQLERKNAVSNRRTSWTKGYVMSTKREHEKYVFATIRRISASMASIQSRSKFVICLTSVNRRRVAWRNSRREHPVNETMKTYSVI